MKRFLILFFSMFLTFNVFAQLHLSYEKVEVTLENAADAVRSLTAPVELEVSGIMMPLSKGDFGDLVSEIRAQKNLIRLNLSKVEGLKEIESETFKDCTSLISVILPDKVTKIGDRGFSNCSNLASVIIPDSVTTIGDYAFELCSSLISVIIPNSVTYIGNNAFFKCCNLATIIIGSNVTYIGIGAFSDCSSLINVAIPGCATIGVSAFSGCKKLIEFYVDGNNSKYSSSDDRKILFNKDKTTLIAYPSATGNIVIPSSVTTIGLNAFMDCSNMTSITIGDNLITIEDGVFFKCENLRNVTIPDSVASIGHFVFGDCESLKYNEYDNGLYLGNTENPYLVLIKLKNENITLCEVNNKTKIIGNYVFFCCKKLKTVNYKGTAEQWKKISIGLGNAYLTNATINYNYRE